VLLFYRVSWRLFCCVLQSRECTALNGNEIKHYISKMKANIKLCTSSFSVVTLPFCSHSVKITFPTLKRMRPTLIDCLFLMKQHLMYVKESRGTIAMVGEVKILVVLQNMSVIHWRSLYMVSLMKNYVTSPFVSE
jgi:hypothetical protein